MPQVRLIGLVLFITTIFLAMAAAATQTTHIRFKQPMRDANGRIIPGWQTPESQLSHPRPPATPGDSILPPATAGNSDAASDRTLQFTAVPVVYPLVVAGSLGLLMWFVPAALTARKPQRKRRTRR